MKPAIKPNYKTTFHRDGSLSYWSVYTQSWHRHRPTGLLDNEIASLRIKDRQKVLAMRSKALAD